MTVFSSHFGVHLPAVIKLHSTGSIPTLKMMYLVPGNPRRVVRHRERDHLPLRPDPRLLRSRDQGPHSLDRRHHTQLREDGHEGIRIVSCFISCLNFISCFILYLNISKETLCRALYFA